MLRWARAKAWHLEGQYANPGKNDGRAGSDMFGEEEPRD